MNKPRRVKAARVSFAVGERNTEQACTRNGTASFGRRAQSYLDPLRIQEDLRTSSNAKTLGKTTKHLIKADWVMHYG